MSSPILARPTVGRTTLRDGSRAITVTAANQRVLVQQRHLDGLIQDLREHR